MPKTIESDIVISKKDGKYVFRAKGEKPVAIKGLGKLVEYITLHFDPRVHRSSSYGRGLTKDDRIIIAGTIGSVLDGVYGGR